MLPVTSRISSVLALVKQIYRWTRKIREPIKPLLHWNIVSAIGVGILLLGIGAVTSQAFSFARWCIVIGGLWLIGWWLVSDYLLSARPADSSSNRREWNSHRLREWVPFTLGVIVIMSLLVFVTNTEREFQQDDAYHKISLTYSVPPGKHNDPLSSMITVKNDSDYVISGRHRIYCQVNRAVGDVGNKYTAGLVGYAFARIGDHWIVTDNPHESLPARPEMPPILSGGDGQTDSCISAFKFTQGTICIDLTVMFRYVLEIQPTKEKEKAIRIVSSRSGDDGYQWYPEPLVTQKDYCQSFVRQ